MGTMPACCLGWLRGPWGDVCPTSSPGTHSPLRLLFFSDEKRVQRRPDRVIFFKALWGKRLRKEVTEAKRKAGVQEEEERGGLGWGR